MLSTGPVFLRFALDVQTAPPRGDSSEFCNPQSGGAVVVRGTCRERTQYTYWQPFIEFLDKVLASKSAVVTTSQLVDLYGK
jgi:hypothetical protein